MAEYISTFTTGFSGVISRELPKSLPGARIIHIYDGLVHFNYSGHNENVSRLAFLNNSFYVLKSFKRSQGRSLSDKLSFAKMIPACVNLGSKAPIKKDNFRIRYNCENQFCKVDRQLMDRAERQLQKATGMRVNRVKPDCEFWYIIRSEGVGFYGELISHRSATEKQLNRGELRPEIASLLCLCANLRDGLTVCDPFCGYCGIEKELYKSRHKFHQIFVSDLKPELVKNAKNLVPARLRHTCKIHEADARNLAHIKDASINAIITDPPWGYYENIGDIQAFYCEILNEFIRILKPHGKIVLLTARKEEFHAACAKLELKISQQIDTLVNGKKAAVFILKTN